MMTAQLTRQINILTIEECETVRRSIHELQPLWDEERCRLGAGISYYKPQAIYYATAKRMNPILQKHFGWLYDKLRKGLAAHYDCPVDFREDLALPGFNIYCGSSPLKLSYNIHVDMQYMDLNWDPHGSADFESTMSFTLPIANPKSGSGLNIWNVTRLTDEQMDQTTINTNSALPLSTMASTIIRCISQKTGVQETSASHCRDMV
jgi:hypothetical protein